MNKFALNCNVEIFKVTFKNREKYVQNTILLLKLVNQEFLTAHRLSCSSSIFEIPFYV